MTKRAASGHAGCASNLTYTSLRMRGGLARVRGRRGGGLVVFCLFVCLLHSIGFMLFIAKVRAEP